MIPEIHIEDYNYGLEDARIAKYPLPERDASKLLHYKDGAVEEKIIEVFCLEPVEPVEYNTAFAATETCSWKCVIGNAKKWKEDTLSLYNPEDNGEIRAIALKAVLEMRNGQTGTVRFSWEGGLPFSRILEIAGTVPIPPYLNRESEAIDTERYQTLYAHIRGSVAAPTAGLHFTQDVLDRIREKGIETETVCLHVGAGTFLPVKSSLVSEHPMHREPFTVSKALLQELAHKDRKLIAVGTTSVRTLESLYYVGVSCIETGRPADVAQWAPYEREYPYSTAEALQAIVDYLDREGHHRSGLYLPPGGHARHQLPSAGEHAHPLGIGLCGRRLAHHLQLRAVPRVPLPQLRRQFSPRKA